MSYASTAKRGSIGASTTTVFLFNMRNYKKIFTSERENETLTPVCNRNMWFLLTMRWLCNAVSGR